MNLLAIDTSTERASVALMQNEEIRSEEQGAQRDHARLLLPTVERLLAEAELNLSQLDGIIYGRGPGSFTGLRIACSVAKGLAYAQDLPVYPVSSLAAIANEVLEQKDEFHQLTVLAVLDARMNELYWSSFNEQSHNGEEQVCAAAKIALSTDKPFVLAGVGYEAYLSQLSPSIQKKWLRLLRCILKQRR